VLKSVVGRLRLVGYLEGFSFLVLLGVAMPLKYAAGKPEAVLVAGWVHGILFVLFVVATLQVASLRKWSRGKLLAAAAASVLPFGPFVLDARLLRAEERAAEAESPPRT
jgi:integral membrane protein